MVFKYYCAAAVASLLWHAPGILVVFKSLESDSFLTLSVPAATGLAIICIVMIFALLVVTGTLSRSVKAYWAGIVGCVVTVALVILVFTLLHALSKQGFYLYYQSLFEGLPHQWVVRNFFPVEQTFRLLGGTGISNLSTLSAGVALSAAVLQTVFIFSTSHPARNAEAL